TFLEQEMNLDFNAQLWELKIIAAMQTEVGGAWKTVIIGTCGQVNLHKTGSQSFTGIKPRQRMGNTRSNLFLVFGRSSLERILNFNPQSSSHKQKLLNKIPLTRRKGGKERGNEAELCRNSIAIQGQWPEEDRPPS
ncbi:hypothetical protein J0S82_014405, partial [Galemys pyrenaicus]